MNQRDLESFTQVPYLAWAKDREGRYIWGNEAINRFAGEDVAGKSDQELVWSHSAESLQRGDAEAMETGEPNYLLENVDASGEGAAQLSVCKWRGELDGQQVCFGISFVVNPTS